MKSFINVEDLGPLDKAMAEAFEIKKDRAHASLPRRLP